MTEIYSPVGLENQGLYVPSTIDEYKDLWGWLNSVRDKSMDQWKEAMREYTKHDMFFLLNFVAADKNKVHSETGQLLYFHEVYLDYCRRNQRYIDELISSVDCSARSFSKSVVRTKLAAIQLIMRYPNIAIAIFSAEKQLASRHAAVIKDELDNNKLLKYLFDDVLWDNPQESAKRGETVWSRDEGLRVKRNLPRVNNTIERHAFFGTSPVGSRFDAIIYDDCESTQYIQNKEQCDKLHESFDATQPLLTPTVFPKGLIFINNTKFSTDGLIARKWDEYKSRNPESVYMYKAESEPVDEGTSPLGGMPQYPFTAKRLWEMYDELRDKTTYGLQMTGSFTAGEDRQMKREWITFSSDTPKKLAKGCNGFVCIDTSRGIYDPTGVVVWSVGHDKRLRWTDGSRKKMDPASPAYHDEIFSVVSRALNFNNRVVAIFVEQLSNQAWADLIRAELQKRGCYIQVIPCSGKLANKDRDGRFGSTKMQRIWSRWAHQLQSGNIIFPTPKSMGGMGIATVDEKGTPFCLVDYFLQHEYDSFPRPKHDDLLDAGALIFEPDYVIPYPSKNASKYNGFEKPKPTARGGQTSWMSAG